MATGLTAFEEPGRYYTFSSRMTPGQYFEIRPRNISLRAKPIVDDESGMCIGYTVHQAPGLWQVYDSDGHFVSLEEVGLESPLIDPIDIALLAYGAFRILFAGSRAILQSGAKSALGIKLSQSTVFFLRSRLKTGLSARNLKMTETAAKHMYNPGRYVPLQLQEKAIRYGVRSVDPQKKPGQFLYRIDMYRLVPRTIDGKVEYIYDKYKLHVLVREKDWTISHFHYDKKF